MRWIIAIFIILLGVGGSYLITSNIDSDPGIEVIISILIGVLFGSLAGVIARNME